MLSAMVMVVGLVGLVFLLPGAGASLGGAPWDLDLVQAEKLLPDDDSAALFGHSVALSGDTALVGAIGDDHHGDNSGSASVFVRSPGAWRRQAKLLASDGAAGDILGYSVALSGDTALVGAAGDNGKGTSSGSAYVFVRSLGAWRRQAKLLASDGAAGDQFGYSVALSGDTALVGAFFDDDHGESSGAAYVFVRSGTAWSEQAKLIPADGPPGAQFGRSVALLGDTAFLGAPRDDHHGESSGGAYVFGRSGETWTQQAKLAGTDGAPGDQFGQSVALSGDTALVGARDDDDRGENSGSAYVFGRLGEVWNERAKLLAADGAPGDIFGYSTALSGDTALVGALSDDDRGAGAGAAYLFMRSGTLWSEQPKLLAPDGAPGDQFGSSVAVSGDTALVGALKSQGTGLSSGSGYLFAPRSAVIPKAVSPIPKAPNSSSADAGPRSDERTLVTMSAMFVSGLGAALIIAVAFRRRRRGAGS
ncbi:MAG: FG-GAP repeat protein [Actinomycetota bacterium]